MPSEGTVFDGFTSIVAQDADTHPSYLPIPNNNITGFVSLYNIIGC
jgi:hypothetical protein